MSSMLLFLRNVKEITVFELYAAGAEHSIRFARLECPGDRIVGGILKNLLSGLASDNLRSSNQKLV